MFQKKLALDIYVFVSGPYQKPLAVVVVGGLFTSTILTLLFIPTIYGWFDKQPDKFNNGE